MNYYNEFDPKIAAWLRQLIADKLIPDGYVDERSIVDVRADDLIGYTQCHFFAGIGGWSLALQLAGWPTDRPVWTGSCPCQPFSAAGKRKGTADERHLWPEFFRLIRECSPDVVFGEQVESAIRLGWLDGVCADMEGEGYAVGSVVLGAHSVNAPHKRQRLYWVADANKERSQGRIECTGSAGEFAVGEDGSRMADSETSEWRWLFENNTGRRGSKDRRSTPWNNFDIIGFTDGKARRIEPGSSPLAHGVPARVVRISGYGNAIVPQVAAEFIKAYMMLPKVRK